MGEGGPPKFLKNIFHQRGEKGGVVAIDCNLQCYPWHTELHLFQAADLPPLFSLPPPSPDEPDKQQMNYYLSCVILAREWEGKVEADLWVARATGDYQSQGPGTDHVPEQADLYKGLPLNAV